MYRLRFQRISKDHVSKKFLRLVTFFFTLIKNGAIIFNTEHPGMFVAHIPVILNGNRDCTYRTLTLKGELLAPNLKFDPECLRLTPVPLGTPVSVNFNIIARGYRRYVSNVFCFSFDVSVLNQFTKTRLITVEQDLSRLLIILIFNLFHKFRLCSYIFYTTTWEITAIWLA